MFQVFNRQMGAYVKMKETKTKGTRIVDVKQKMPKVPFKGVPTRKKNKM